MSTTTRNGERNVVRLREVKSSMGMFTLITWGVFELRGRTPIRKAFLTRKDAAEWVIEQGWRYLGSQEAAR